MMGSIEQSKENGVGPSGRTIVKGSEDQYRLTDRVLSTEKGLPEDTSGAVSKPCAPPLKDSLELSRENG